MGNPKENNSSYNLSLCMNKQFIIMNAKSPFVRRSSFKKGFIAEYVCGVYIINGGRKT